MKLFRMLSELGERAQQVKGLSRQLYGRDINIYEHTITISLLETVNLIPRLLLSPSDPLFISNASKKPQVLQDRIMFFAIATFLQLKSIRVLRDVLPSESHGEQWEYTQRFIAVDVDGLLRYHATQAAEVGFPSITTCSSFRLCNIMVFGTMLRGAELGARLAQLQNLLWQRNTPKYNTSRTAEIMWTGTQTVLLLTAALGCIIHSAVLSHRSRWAGLAVYALIAWQFSGDLSRVAIADRISMCVMNDGDDSKSSSVLINVCDRVMYQANALMVFAIMYLVRDDFDVYLVAGAKGMQVRLQRKAEREQSDLYRHTKDQEIIVPIGHALSGMLALVAVVRENQRWQHIVLGRFVLGYSDDDVQDDEDFTESNLHATSNED